MSDKDFEVAIQILQDNHRPEEQTTMVKSLPDLVI